MTMSEKEAQLQEQINELTAELEQLHLDLIRAGVRDKVSGAYTRVQFIADLKREENRVARGEAPLSLILIDIDNFNEFNESRGRESGDKVLHRIYLEINQALHRSSDTVYRFGGDEFAILLPVTDPGGATTLALRITDSVNALVLPYKKPNGEMARLTVSAGVASLKPERALTDDQIIEHVLEALQDAQSIGGSQVVTSIHGDFHSSETIIQ